MNPFIEGIPASQIRAINSRKKPGDIDLGLGEPTLKPDLTAFEAALAWTGDHGSPYSPNAGFAELRELIADYTGRYTGTKLSQDQICVTVGSEEAIYLAIKSLVDVATEEVLIVEPCYLAYPKICQLEGIAHRTVALDGFREFAPSAGVVLNAIRPETVLIVLNSPSNPTGRIWDQSEIELLTAGLAEMGREDVYILADEVYRELFYSEQPPASTLPAHPRTLIAGSLSKSNSLTGLRLGWLAGPTTEIAAATKVHQFVNTAASTFSQRVAIELFQANDLGVNRGHYHAMRDFLLASAGHHALELIRPEGAFYALIRIPSAVAGSSVDVASRLIEEKRVVAVPGTAFGESAEGWLRISWVAGEEQLDEGLRRISDFFEEELY